VLGVNVKVRRHAAAEQGVAVGWWRWWWAPPLSSACGTCSAKPLYPRCMRCRAKYSVCCQLRHYPGELTILRKTACDFVAATPGTAWVLAEGSPYISHSYCRLCLPMVLLASVMHVSALAALLSMLALSCQQFPAFM
jgi:hypothetical protein